VHQKSKRVKVGQVQNSASNKNKMAYQNVKITQVEYPTGPRPDFYSRINIFIYLLRRYSQGFQLISVIQEIMTNYFHWLCPFAMF
jgi:hypothetical protein